MNYYLSQKESTLLIILFTYRGMRAKDLAVFYTESYRYTLADEKSIYNYLSKMKAKGLIKATRLQGVYSLGSIYYLTQSGNELVKEILNISVGQQGTGVLPLTEDTTFWDIPYEYQTPPLKQTDHFLMTIEFFKQVITSRDFIYHSTAFYSNLNYTSNKKECKVKPDASVNINGNFYAVEMDRATESHEQLLEKFKKYKEHYDFCQNTEDKSKVTPVHTILFVVEARTRQHGIKRRWANVLSAFFKAFGKDFPPINLILVPINEVGQTLEFELSRADLEAKSFEKFKTTFTKEGFNTLKSLGNYPLVFNDAARQCKIIFHHLNLEFESRLYKDNYDISMHFFNFKQKYSYLFKPGKALEGIEFQKPLVALYFPLNAPTFAEGIETTGIHPNLLEKVMIIEHNFKLYRAL